MWTLTWKGLLAAKARFVMTALAVIIGTGFVAGALTFGDTLEEGFDRLFTSIVGTADAIVRAEDPEDTRTGDPFEGALPTFPTEVVDRLVELDEVEVAEGEVEGVAILIGDDGEPTGQFGPPTLGYSAFDNDELDPAQLRTGRWPETADEVAIDAGTANAQEWAVGDRVGLVLDGPVERPEVVGTFGLGDLDNLAGASVVVLDRATALDRLGSEGELTAAYAVAADGIDEAELVAAIEAELGEGFTVQTAAEVVAEQQEAFGPFIEIFSIALLVFAVIALLVGSFLIFNTFTIVLAGRLRELALLRAVGASRGQLFGSVLGEAALVGAVGGALGAAFGVVVARGLQAILGTIGIELPGDQLIVLPRTILVAILVGVVITVLAAIVPARRAVTIPPVAALTEVAVAAPSGRGIVRNVLGVMLLVGGAAALATTLLADAGALTLGVGAVALFIGVAALSSLIVGPLARLLGGPSAMLGVSGELARANAMRNPRRTAATASALMIGLALVSFVSIFAASLQGTIRDTIDSSFLADAIVQSNTLAGLPDTALDAVATVDDVAVVASAAAGQVEIGDRIVLLGVMDVDELRAVLDLDVTGGDLAGLSGGGVALTETIADDLDVVAGDEVVATVPDGEANLPVVAVFDGGGIDVGGFMDTGTWSGYGGTSAAAFNAYVLFATDADVTDTLEAVEEVLADYPQVRVLDQAGFAEALASQLDQLLGVVLALLALSVLVALLGIVNTLALSVVERTREIGLLRAVGMTRPQVRRMVRTEAISVALIGAALGLLLGVPLGAVFVRIEQLNITELVLPWTQIAIGVVLAAIAGLLAGVLPARRAANLDVLDALHSE
ncbi:MAG: ABC transporter permease [Nitriliruptor sp.]|nr:MAG: ABC transporter permease [Nitriliruptor sp.]